MSHECKTKSMNIFKLHCTKSNASLQQLNWSGVTQFGKMFGCLRMLFVGTMQHAWKINWKELPSISSSASEKTPALKTSEKSQFSHLFLFQMYYFNLLQRAKVAGTKGVNSNCDKADRISSHRVWKSDYCIVRTDGKSHGRQNRERWDFSGFFLKQERVISP